MLYNSRLRPNFCYYRGDLKSGLPRDLLKSLKDYSKHKKRVLKRRKLKLTEINRPERCVWNLDERFVLILKLKKLRPLF
jgi:hypothetical protein